jgi:hypothetical protein
LPLERHLLKNAGMNMGAITERHTRLERELMEERAATLRRIGQTLESLIEELRTLQQRIGKVHWSSRSPDVARYRELRRRALQYRWYLEVQREALGLRDHSVLDEFYRVPNPI